MATENIKTGQIYRILTDATNKVWTKIFFEAKASDVKFEDGKTAEEKIGMIDGITSDLNSDSETTAASIKSVNEVKNNLGGISFYEDTDGNKYAVGADSVPKKLGGKCGYQKINLIADNQGGGGNASTSSHFYLTPGLFEYMFITDYTYKPSLTFFYGNDEGVAKSYEKNELIDISTVSHFRFYKIIVGSVASTSKVTAILFTDMDSYHDYMLENENPTTT